MSPTVKKRPNPTCLNMYVHVHSEELKGHNRNKELMKEISMFIYLFICISIFVSIH